VKAGEGMAAARWGEVASLLAGSAAAGATHA